jgi:hypothetical protein
MQIVGHGAYVGAAPGTVHGRRHRCRRLAEEQHAPVSQQIPEGDYRVQNSEHLEVMKLGREEVIKPEEKLRARAT